MGETGRISGARTAKLAFAAAACRVDFPLTIVSVTVVVTDIETGVRERTTKARAPLRSVHARKKDKRANMREKAALIALKQFK